MTTGTPSNAANNTNNTNTTMQEIEVSRTTTGHLYPRVFDISSMGPEYRSCIHSGAISPCPEVHRRQRSNSTSSDARGLHSPSQASIRSPSEPPTMLLNLSRYYGPSPPGRERWTETPQHHGPRIVFASGTNSLTSSPYGHRRQESALSSMSGSAESVPPVSDAEDGMESVRFEQRYRFTQTIYECHLSSTFQCVHLDSNRIYCVKQVFHKQYRCSADEDIARNEIRILQKLRDLDARRSVRLVDVMADSRHDFIVTELVHARNLQSILQEYKERGMHMEEDRAKRIIRSLLKAVEELHGFDILHHDITPDNVLVDEYDQVRLCDFGAAKDEAACLCRDRHGNKHFTAPEILQRMRHGKPADVWSVGVIAFCCLSGRLPFYDDARATCAQRVNLGQYSFYTEEWDNVTTSAKQFVANLLFTNAEIRLTAFAALDHDWLAAAAPPPLPQLLPREKKPGSLAKFMSKLGMGHNRRHEHRSKSTSIVPARSSSNNSHGSTSGRCKSTTTSPTTTDSQGYNRRVIHKRPSI